MNALLAFFLILSLAVRIILNWKVYNCLHPKKPIRAVFKPVGFLFNSTREIQEKDTSNIHFIYCTFVFFWIKYPRDNLGKRMAHAVWILSIMHVLIIFLIIYGP